MARSMLELTGEGKTLIEIFQQGVEDPSQLDQNFLSGDNSNQKF